MKSPLAPSPCLLGLAIASALCLAPPRARCDSPAATAAAPSADAVLNDLKAGNQRFVDGKTTRPHADRARLQETAAGQKPVATVLTCSDSRVSPEIILDQGLGDVFVVRVAGNVADTDEIGTIEYGTEHLHTPLLLVLGHTKCGAVSAVVDNAKVGGSIPGLVSHIKPAVERSRSDGAASAGAPAAAGVARDAFVAKAIKENVWESVETLFKKSEELRGLVNTGKVKVVGAVYDIATGQIEWLGQHPKQAALMAAKN